MDQVIKRSRVFVPDLKERFGQLEERSGDRLRCCIRDLLTVYLRVSGIELGLCRTKFAIMQMATNLCATILRKVACFKFKQLLRGWTGFVFRKIYHTNAKAAVKPRLPVIESGVQGYASLFFFCYSKINQQLGNASITFAANFGFSAPV